MKGNAVNTIPYCCRPQIPREAAADFRPDSGTGSRLFEVNIWMWKYGRPFPRKFSVDEAVAMQKRGCRNPGQEELQLFSAGARQQPQNGHVKAMNVMDNGI